VPNFTTNVMAFDNCTSSGALMITQSPSAGTVVGLGTTSVTLYVADAAGNTNTCSTSFTVRDTTPPSVTNLFVDKPSLWPPNHKMQTVTVNYTGTDNCGGTNVTGVLSVTSSEPINGTGDGDTAPDWELIDAHHVKLRAERAKTGTNRVYTITIICSDSSTNRTTNAVQVVVAHDITAPASGAAFKINTAVNFAGTFWDVPGNKHTASWTFDSLSTSGSVTEPSGLKNGTVKGTYKFGTPGVYKVTLFVKDQKGVTSWVNTAGDTESIVVIYDPNGGYTIGGGWINSPPGAYTPDPSLTGKLSFGFSSQYFKGAANPKGEALVNFLAGDMEFSALNLDYLSISGAKAQFRGFGKINGISGYNFILTVIDGALAGGGDDKFRIKIWEKVSGQIIYDNELGRSDADDPITSMGDATSTVLIKK
jgi:HYR domain-containing protein